MELPFAEPFKIKTVEHIRKSTPEEREKWIADAGFNLFNLKSEQVFIDLMTDSGTSAMSDEQWASLMLGDESYAGSSSYYLLWESVQTILGFGYFLPVHQGRAAENVLFSELIREGDIVPGNAHFDTTKGHIEFRKAEAVDCTVEQAKEINSPYPFKGNLDISKLDALIKTSKRKKIPFILITMTCNTVGGQPVSMENIRDVRSLADKYGLPLVFDAARFAENAWFIKNREEGYAKKPVQEIIREMFGYADAMTMSSKKDGLVNIGGLLCFRHRDLFEKCSVYNILYEGFNTYGGLAGRDMAALATGLREVSSETYLESRIRQVERLGEKIREFGIEIQYPTGGHAVFVNATHFMEHLPEDEFRAQTLAVELYLESGVRSVEIGPLLADRHPVSRKNRFPETEFLRLAIPRRVYTDNHMDFVAVALQRVFERRKAIKRGLYIIREAPIMRHFTIQLGRH